MDLITRKAVVKWEGDSRHFHRTETTQSGLLKNDEWSMSHCETDCETYPAELIAAAEASSFSLALSAELAKDGFTTGEVVTTATVSLDHSENRWTITQIHLDVRARLPDATQGEFIDAAVRAKGSCVVSTLVRTSISMNARLQKDTLVEEPAI